MINHAKACALARAVNDDPNGRMLLAYIIDEVCGVKQSIGTQNDLSMAAGVGRHNVGIELLEMLKETTE